MDMELLMARARLNHLAKISPVGTPTQFNGSVSSGGSASIPIPSASQAGDVLLIVGQISTAQSSITVTPPAGSTTVIAPTFYASNVSPAQSYFGLAYLYPLTATDITNGSVSVSATGASTLFFDIAALALRGAGTLLDGAIGQVIQASQQTLPVNITVPGVTTSVVNDFLVYLVAVTTGDPSDASSPYVFSTPIGWSKAIDTYSTGYSPVSVGYLNQTSAGSVGSAAVNFSRSDSLNDASAFAGWMLAIKAKAPAIILSATFPTSTNVGTAVSFDVIATLVDGATGTPTITVDQLPDGLTLGSTSMVDATHYKATVSGTLTTAQDVTSTFSATGGSVAATPKVHTFSVQAAGIMNVVQIATTYRSTSGPPIPLTLASVKKDDLIVAVLNYNASEPNWVFNVTDTDSNVYGALANAIGGGGARDIYTWSAIAANDVANLEVDVSIVGHSVGGMFTLYQIRGGKVVASDCVNLSYVSLQPSATDLTSPAFNTADGAFVIAPASIYISAQSPTFDPILPSAGNYASDADNTSDTSNHFYCGNVTGTGAQTGMSITWTHNPASYQWRATCVVLPINPA